MSVLLPPRVLNADDYALSAGVSRSIAMLAEARRISATSAFTSLPRWVEDARRIRELRGQVAIGLHLNLTVGAPLGRLDELAPSGTFLPLEAVLRATLLRRVAPEPVRDEIRRQLDAFERELGFPPDHIDGHQHVHVLPVVRQALIEEVAQRYRETRPLLRDPTQALAAVALQGPARRKALAVRGFALGFARQARRRGLSVNTGFGGFSTFDTTLPYAYEVTAALDRRHDTATLKLVMCHPGFPDEELARLDPITSRRQQEHDVLLGLAPPDVVIWHPADGRANRAMPDWAAVVAGRTAA